MRASVVVQTLGRHIQIAIHAAEQYRWENQAAIRANAMTKPPVVQTAGQNGTIRARRDLQGPVTGPEDLAQVGRACRAQRNIRLEIETSLAGPALQNQLFIAGATLQLALMCPGTSQIQHAIDRLADAVAKGECRRDIDIRADAAMAQHSVSAEQIGCRIYCKYDIGDERQIIGGQCQPQRERISLVPGGNAPRNRLMRRACQDHGGVRGRQQRVVRLTWRAVRTKAISAQRGAT